MAKILMTSSVYVDSVLYAASQVVEFAPPRDADVVNAGYGVPALDAAVFVEHANRVATESGQEAPPMPVETTAATPKIGFWRWLFGG